MISLYCERKYFKKHHIQHTQIQSYKYNNSQLNINWQINGITSFTLQKISQSRRPYFKFFWKNCPFATSFLVGYKSATAKQQGRVNLNGKKSPATWWSNIYGNLFSLKCKILPNEFPCQHWSSFYLDCTELCSKMR